MGQRPLPRSPRQVNTLVAAPPPQIGRTDQSQLCCGHGRDGCGCLEPLWLLPARRARRGRTLPDLTGQQLIRGRQRERWPGRNRPADQRRLGHRHIRSQARHAPGDQQRPRQHPTTPPRTQVGQQRSRRGHDHPVDREGRESSDPARLPMPGHQGMHVQIGHCPGNERQQRHARDSGPTDPPVRARARDRLPTANSPASTHWLFGALPPRTPKPGNFPQTRHPLEHAGRPPARPGRPHPATRPGPPCRGGRGRRPCRAGHPLNGPPGPQPAWHAGLGILRATAGGQPARHPPGSRRCGLRDRPDRRLRPGRRPEGHWRAGLALR
jgi:hypothetical protein